MTCNLCGVSVGLAELESHLRLLHPDVYEPFETWPDGGLVIVDQSDPAEALLGEEGA